MNDNAKKWVEALRRGEYHQGEKRLHYISNETGEHYCCLGVACYLYNKYSDVPIPTTTQELEKGVEEIGYNGQYGVLPTLVREWLGLRNDRGLIGPNLSLTHLNDMQIPFSGIADFIESEPKGLFYDSGS